MGLDIRAYAFRDGRHFTDGRAEEQFHYWRKHHALRHWCSGLAVERGEPAWEDPWRSILLDEKDLDRLETAVRNGELPDYYERERKVAGFWQPCDLIFIVKARALIAAGLQVEIEAEW